MDAKFANVLLPLVTAFLNFGILVFVVFKAWVVEKESFRRIENATNSIKEVGQVVQKVSADVVNVHELVNSRDTERERKIDDLTNRLERLLEANTKLEIERDRARENLS